MKHDLGTLRLFLHIGRSKTASLLLVSRYVHSIVAESVFHLILQHWRKMLLRQTEKKLVQTQKYVMIPSCRSPECRLIDSCIFSFLLPSYTFSLSTITLLSLTHFEKKKAATRGWNGRVFDPAERCGGPSQPRAHLAVPNEPAAWHTGLDPRV